MAHISSKRVYDNKSWNRCLIFFTLKHDLLFGTNQCTKSNVVSISNKQSAAVDVWPQRRLIRLCRYFEPHRHLAENIRQRIPDYTNNIFALTHAIISVPWQTSIIIRRKKIASLYWRIIPQEKVVGLTLRTRKYVFLDLPMNIYIAIIAIEIIL